jgi:hypothetical protein
MADAARQRAGAVVREHVAVERIERRVVDVRREDALFEIVEDDDLDRAAEPAKRLLVELGPDPAARLPGEEADGLAAVAQGEDEEPRAPILPALRVADHGAVAVVDLRLLARCGEDDGVRIRQSRRVQRADEAADARVPGREAVAIDEVLPNGHRVAAAAERLDDHLAVRLARTRLGTSTGWRRPGIRARVGRHLYGRFCRRRPRVGGHLHGRFCRARSPPR